jgi:peptidoglycan/LPS O-acetylase OafA/YrhL
MPLIEKLRHRPEIDGLRALAVMVVVLFHADFGFSGGFVGVDVFFVISGFLITSLIWNDLESGQFSLASFFERRARRIMPALIVVTFATILAGWFLMLPPDYKSLGRALQWQTTFTANLYYMSDMGYFARTSLEKPLLHVWSLAVEEQFYFVIPLLLWGLYRIPRFRSRSAVMGVLGLGLLLSLALSTRFVSIRPNSSFFLLQSRAWELLVGSLLAFLPTAPRILGHRAGREVFSVLGLGLILFSVFKYDSDTRFPGPAALLPCLGAGLLIWANGNGLSGIGRVLSWRPLVFIGGISYSLYLWHWPLLALARNVALFPLGATTRVALVAAGLVCAIASWKWVETPFRKRKLGASRASMFAYTLAGIVLVGGAGVAMKRFGGFPNRFSPQSQQYARGLDDLTYRIDLTTADVRAGKLIPIGAKNEEKQPSLLVWGDSHAMAAMSAIDAYLKEKNLSGVAATHSAMAPVLDWWRPPHFKRDAVPLEYNQTVFEQLKRQKIPNVLLAAYWYPCVRVDGGKGSEGNFSEALLRTVRQIKALGAQPYVMLDVPRHEFDPPKALAQPMYSAQYLASICQVDTGIDDLQVQDKDLLAKLEAAGAKVLNPKPYFVAPGGKNYLIAANGYSLYADGRHLTTHGARLLMPLFCKEFKF